MGDVTATGKNHGPRTVSHSPSANRVVSTGRILRANSFYASCLLTGFISTKQFIMIYSITKQRSAALLSETKEYIYYVINEFRSPTSAIRQQFMNLGMTFAPTFLTNNVEGFTVTSMLDENVQLEMLARPGKHNSCRGDAGTIIGGDEFSWFTKPFWEKFMRPLLAVGKRALTLATTPGETGAHTTEFMRKTEERMANGNYSWYLLNHSLMCSFCHEAKRTRCAHRLYLLPPWKSNIRIQIQLESIPEDSRDDFKAEVRTLATCLYPYMHTMWTDSWLPPPHRCTAKCTMRIRPTFPTPSQPPRLSTPPTSPPLK